MGVLISCESDINAPASETTIFYSDFDGPAGTASLNGWAHNDSAEYTSHFPDKQCRIYKWRYAFNIILRTFAASFEDKVTIMSCICTISLFFLLLIVPNLRAQFWESTGGPAGDHLWAMYNINEDLYVLSKQIHRSTDNGFSWQLVAPSIDLHSTENYQARIFAGRGQTLYVHGASSDVWKSSDNGESWIELRPWVGNYSSFVVTHSGLILIKSNDSLFISSDDGQTWSDSACKGTYLFVDSNDILYSASYGNELYRSTNYGASWLKIINGLPKIYSQIKIVSPKKGMVLCAIDEHLFMSVDDGSVWAEIHTSTHPITALLPIGADTVLLLNRGGRIDRSVDAGKSWSVYDTAFKKYGSYDAFDLCKQGQTIFVVFLRKLFTRTLETDTWKEVIVPTGRIRFLSSDSTGRIYAVSANDGGSSRMWIHDDSWTEESNFPGPNPIYLTALKPDIGGNLYALSSRTFIRSLDKAKTWTSHKTFTDSFPSSQFRMCVGGSFIYVVSDEQGVFRSSDQGLTWDQLNEGITDQKLSSIAIANSGTVYAGGASKFYRSNDFGRTWEEPVFPFILGSEKVAAIAAHGDNVFVGVDRTGVYFSSDGGTLWENHSDGLMNDTIFDLLASPSEALFLVSTTGIYEYSPLTQKWINIMEKPLQTKVLSLALGADGRVYAGTEGDGVYRTTKTYGSWFSSLVRDNYQPDDISIYPNPASPEVTLHFATGRPEKFKTIIYSLLGEPILSNTNEETLDVSSLHSGQYFLRVIFGDKVRTMPLSIVR